MCLTAAGLVPQLGVDHRISKTSPLVICNGDDNEKLSNWDVVLCSNVVVIVELVVVVTFLSVIVLSSEVPSVPATDTIKVTSVAQPEDNAMTCLVGVCTVEACCVKKLPI